jgi:hypothetical protein
MMLWLRTALLASLLLVLLPAAPGRAGVYTVHSCQSPDGGAADRDAWRDATHDTDQSSRLDGCPLRPLYLTLDRNEVHPGNGYVNLKFTAPSDTQITAYTLWRSAQVASTYNAYVREHHDRGITDREKCLGPCTKGVLRPSLADANRISVRTSARPLRTLELLLTCGRADASSETCPASSLGARLQLHRADIELRDDLAPVIVTPPSGPLVNARGPLAGVQSVSLTATDRGGGVSQVAFEVDGTVVERVTLDANGGACRVPFRAPVPCKPVASGTVGFDTAKVPDGTHSLRILVTDATGTNVTPWGPVTITTANRSCNPAPRVDSLELTARIAGGGRKRGGRKKGGRRVVATAYGRKVRVRGTLRTPEGAPVPHAALCVATRQQRAHAPLRPARALTTDAAGRFSFRLPRGPSRRAYVVARVPGGAVSSSVVVRVKAPVRLRPSRRHLRNGQSLKLRGRLRGRPRPRRGMLVEMQVQRGRRYQTFATTHARRNGRFSLRYRFTRTSGVQRYRFRALVRRQPTYPYATGASRPVVVRVHG